MATITIPEIAPPLKAVRNASFMLLLAALAVFRFALTETSMLTMPAIAELMAPKRKDTEVLHPKSVFPR